MEIVWALDALDFRALIDILIVTLFFFGASLLFRGSQAVALLRGTVMVFITLVAFTSLFQLQALSWLLRNLVTVLVFAIPVVFQPEIRRVLEQLGRGNILSSQATPNSVRTSVIDEVCQAAEKLSERRHGALIVIQRNAGLQDYTRTGIILNSVVTSQLLLTIFWPKTELHDGAAIIDSRGLISAAAAVLPLTASRNLPNRKMGTRHRAALGISEVTDALCVVVSEETGKIAITNGGRMVSRLDSERLRTILNAFYGSEAEKSVTLLGRLRDSIRQFFTQIQNRISFI